MKTDIIINTTEQAFLTVILAETKQVIFFEFPNDGTFLFTLSGPFVEKTNLNYPRIKLLASVDRVVKNIGENSYLQIGELYLHHESTRNGIIIDILPLSARRIKVHLELFQEPAKPYYLHLQNRIKELYKKRCKIIDNN